MIGYPLGIAILLRRIKSRSEVGLDSLSLYARFGLLFSPYKKKFYYWEVRNIICLLACCWATVP